MFNDTSFNSEGYICTRFSTAAFGVTSYGIKCQGSSFTSTHNFYQCNLNLDVQNETSYTCKRCFNAALGIYRNNSVCDVDFKLRMQSMVFESALKNILLNLPVSQMCNWDQLSCVDFRNYNVVGHNSLEVIKCIWSHNYQSEQSLSKQIEYDWSFLFVIFFIVAGGVGNILVCLAICLDKRLQNVTNYFLLSLAIADLLVSLFVMPMGAIPGFLGYWPLGVAWCNVYVTCDVLACSASIMHMCFISIGRYVGIRNPLKSRHHSTNKVVIVKIALVWLLSMIVSSSITVLGLINRKNIMPNHDLCVINNRLFWIFGSLVAFYIPMMTMVVSFALTVNLLKKQAILAAVPVTGGIRSRSKIGMSGGHPQRRFTSGSEGGGGRRARGRGVGGTQTPSNIATESSTLIRAVIRPLNILTPSTLNLRFSPRRMKDRSLAVNAVANEQKATKVLGLVFFTFVLCWAPFFLLNIIFASCPTCNIPDNVVEVCLWLGYVSSTINPIIYTIFNRTFRKAFLRLLCCHCSRRERCTLYRCMGSTRGASRLCAPAAVPLALALRPADTVEAAGPQSTDRLSSSNNSEQNLK